MHRTARVPTTVEVLIAAAAVIVIAAALRVAGIDRLALWWDEGWSIYFAGLPVAEMFEATSLDIHPPLYYLLLRWWAEVLGYSAAAARALSVLAGLGVVALGWALARRLLGGRTAVLAALLLALAPAHVFHSQEARMYALATALALASWLTLLRREGAGRRQLVHSLIYGLVTAAALYTEYYAALLWLGQAAYLLGRDRNGSVWERLRRHSWLLVPVFLYLPWVGWGGPRLVAYVAQKQTIEGYRAFDPLTYAWQHLSAFAGGHTLPGQSGLVASLATVLLVALAGLGWRAMGADPRRRWMVACLGLLPLTLAYLVHLAFPFTPAFYERILLPFSAPLYLAAAHGVVRGLGPGWVRLALGTAAVLIPSLNLAPTLTEIRYAATDYRPIFEVIHRSGDASDAVLCVHPWQYGYVSAYLPSGSAKPVLVPTERWSNPGDRFDDLASHLSLTRVLWFPSHESLGRILESDIAADLESQAATAYAGWFDEDTLLLAYARGETDLTEGGQGRFADGTALAASAYSEAAAAGTGVVSVLLHWQEDASGDADVSLRLVDDIEQVWAASDFPLADGDQRRALLVPWGTPLVPLRLTVQVSRGGSPVSLLDAPGVHALEVGRVSIAPPVSLPARPESLVDRRLDARFANGLRLIGSSTAGGSYVQGDPVPLSLWWQSELAIATEPVVFVQALDESGGVVAATEARITGGTWSPTLWPTGYPVRDQHALLLPADAPAGRLTVIAGLLDPATRAGIPPQEGSHVELGKLSVQPAPRTWDRPAVPAIAAIDFAGVAALDGYEVTPCPDLGLTCLRDAGDLQVRLLWQARSTTAIRYRSFVHLTCDGRIVAQSDQDPAGARSTAWLPEQYLDDRHRLSLTGIDSCPTGFELRVGMYDSVTEVRLDPASAQAEAGTLRLEAQQSR